MGEGAQRRRLGLVIAVLAAVAIRFLTPVGWMPNPNGGAGGSPIVICTAQGPHLARSLDLPAPGRDHDAGHDHCLFAGFALVGGSDLVFAATPPLRFAVDAGKLIAQWAPPLPGEQHRLQFPRGPPLAGLTL